MCAIPLPRAAGHRRHAWGAAGLTASAGIAGWVEILLAAPHAQCAHRQDRPAAIHCMFRLWTPAISQRPSGSRRGRYHDGPYTRSSQAHVFSEIYGLTYLRGDCRIPGPTDRRSGLSKRMAERAKVQREKYRSTILL